MTNYGNQIEGGTFNGPTAIGTNATINYAAGGEGNATGRLARDLQTLIEQHAGSLEKPELARRDAEEVAEELARPADEQDSDRLSDTIKRLAGRVASVSALAEATKRLAELIVN